MIMIKLIPNTTTKKNVAAATLVLSPPQRMASGQPGTMLHRANKINDKARNSLLMYLNYNLFTNHIDLLMYNFKENFCLYLAKLA